MPARSPSEPYDLAVVALSARALARSAKRAGLRALAIDLFADADTREHAACVVRVPPARSGLCLDRTALIATLRRHAPEGLPVTLGAGFEHAPKLMRAIGGRNPILGARPDTVALLKNPEAFAALLQRLGIAHPDTISGDAAARPMEGDWLSKRVGASGGSHIRVSTLRPGVQRYLQRRVRGRAISTLFLADGLSASVAGYSEQWTDPTRRKPFRYGGAVGPVIVEPYIGRRIAEALDALVAATGLRGLASADMILPYGAPEDFILVEINPRPGATLDVFDRGDGPSLLALHLEASAGRLPPKVAALETAHAAAVVYARRAVSVAGRQRPVWTADWPSCDDVIPAGAPICTIIASAATPSGARALVETRRAQLLALLRGPAAALNNTVTA